MRNLFFVFPIFLLPFLAVAEIQPSDSSLTRSDSVIGKHRTNKEIYYNQGLGLYTSEKFSEAILYFDTCLSIDTLFIDARFMKALSLEKKGDLNQSINEFERIKKENPRYDDIDKRINNYYITVYLSKNWYYMLAMLFIVILLMAVVVKTLAYKKMQ